MSLIRSVLFSTMWAEMRANRARSLAFTITIALGTALLAAALVLGASMQRVVEQGMGVEFTNADLVLQTDREGNADSDGLPKSDLSRLAAVEGVSSVGTHVQTRAVAQVEGVTRGILVDSLSSQRSFRWQRWAVGRAPETPTEVALTRRALDELHIQVGDQVALSRSGVERVNFTVVGEVNVQDSFRHTDVAYGIVVPQVARDLAGSQADNTALIGLADGADAREVMARINEGAPPAQAQLTQDLTRSIAGQPVDFRHASTSLATGFGFGAGLFAALLLAAVTAISLEGRRKFLALLGSVGATRIEAAAVVISEALILGLVGALFGTGLGVALAMGATTLVGLGAFVMPTGAVLWPAVAMIALGLIAGVVPAVLSTRIRPARSRTVTAWGVAGLLLAALGVMLGFQRGSAFQPGNVESLLACALALSVGVLLALPAVIRLVATTFAKLGFVRRDAPRSLGAGWLGEQPGRAVGEVFAIVLACAMVSFGGLTLASVDASASTRLSESAGPDLVLGSPTSDAPLAEETLAEVAKVPGVDKVSTIEFGQDVSILGKDADGKQVSFSPGTVAGDVEELDRSLPGEFPVRTIEEGKVYLPASSPLPFADGSQVSLKGPDRKVNGLEVVRVPGLGLPSVTSINQVFQVTQFNDDRMAWLSLDPDVDSSRVLEEISGVVLLAGDAPVSGVLPDDLRIVAAVDTAHAAAKALLALAVLFAIITVVALGALSVRERSREHAVLRAIGLEWLGLKHLLMLRVLVGAFVGAAVGLLVGGALAFFVTRAAASTLGVTPAVAVPWLTVLVLFLVVLGAVRAACVIPLERASLIRPARAMASE